jgi:uncharacterized protein with FMN-binding domain
MKRAPIVFTGTIAGLAGVLGYHTVSTRSKVVSSTGSPTTKTATAAARASNTSSPPRTASTRSATGQDVSFQYGDLQLKVTMSGTRMTNVSVVQLNETDPRSQSIDDSAVPQLTQEAVAAQSAKIDGVSGASYTSQAYEQSLQSALDKLGQTSSGA